MRFFKILEIAFTLKVYFYISLTDVKVRNKSKNLIIFQMFSGNIDGNEVHKNEFEVPIITQWIRINPTRWRDRISMRVELFGCEYRKKILDN